MDHDRLFKLLLTTFFVEFVQLFLPDVAAYLEPASIEFMDKEVFTDLTAGESHEVDLLVKVRFKGEEAFFLVHVENQASAQSDFPRRMFTYFARLHEKYHLPIFPIVIFSYDTPLRPEPTRYRVAFPGRTVLQFEYVVIQLNRLSWRRFAGLPNPVASALMAKMKIAPKDRPKVRLECFRLLATLRINPAKSKLIGTFVESYLRLSAEEMRQYERAFARLAPEEKEASVELMNSWEQRGLEQGLRQGLQQGQQQGMERIVLRLLRTKVGELPHSLEQRIDGLTGEMLERLTIASLNMTTPADLETWLAEHGNQ